MSSEPEPPAKKLRSSEPDLQVILGNEDNKVIQWHHSPTLAGKSRYVDAMLSTPMKEKDALTISFPDISSETWDLMMKYLDDPVASRKMGPRDVLNVAEFYDKYEFGGGVSLCNQVLIDYFEKANDMEKDNSIDVDLIIDSVAIAHKANLDASFKTGMMYVWFKMCITDIPYGRTMFTPSQLRIATPALQHFRENYSNEVRRIRFGGLISDLHNQLHEPEFPQKFVSECKQWAEHRLIGACIAGLELSGCNCEADGEYEGDCMMVDFRTDRTAKWNGVTNTFAIEKHEEGWVIMRKTLPRRDEEGELDYDSVVENKCWIAVCSHNLPLPPFSNWRPCDPLARGNPKVTYILRERISSRNIGQLF